MTENGNGTGMLTGLCMGAVLGAVVGAGVALLYAPRTGKETRELLARKAQEARDKAKTAIEQGMKTVKGEVENIASTGELPSFNRGSGSARQRT